MMGERRTSGPGTDPLPELSDRESLARPESVPVQGGVMGTDAGTGERNGAGQFVKTPSLKSSLVRDIKGVPEEDRWLVDRSLVSVRGWHRGSDSEVREDLAEP